MNPPRRYLAIDLGDRRTGLAVGDTFMKTASPVGQLEIPIDANKGESLLEALCKATNEHLGPQDELVLGLPLNMDDTEGPRAKLARAWAARLEERTGKKVHLHDERRTSIRAESRLNQSGLTHKQKKARRDAIAAAAILQDFIDQLEG